MSKWEDNYKNHQIHTTIQSLLEALGDNDLISDDLNVSGMVDRIRQAVSYSQSCLDNVLPSLASQGNLNNANSSLQNILNELNSYKANNNIGHLNNTSNHIDTLIPQLSSFPIPRPIIEENVFSKSIILFKEQAENIIKHLSDKKDTLEQQLNEVSTSSSEAKEELSRLEQLIEEQNEVIESAIEDFKTQFSTLESSLQAELQQSVVSNAEKTTEQIEQASIEHNNLIEEHRKTAEELVLLLETKKEEASNLVQIIGNIGITGNYQKIANQEQKAANTWRNIALFLMLLMAGAIALTIFLSVENGFDWKLAIFRLMAALILVIPATYAAKESSKHRALENHNRKAELELASLDPYLEKLPEEKRHQIKESLTEKFFGLGTEISNDEPVSYNALLELVKTAIKGK